MSDITVGYKVTCSELEAITYIEPTWCIGNSLEYINTNFANLKSNESELCESLTSAITAVESFKAIPLGTIVMWSGIVVNSSNTAINSNDIIQNAEAYIQVNGNKDSNWAVCTGRVYGAVTTPNLIGRFIVGAGRTPNTSTFNDDDRIQYNVGDTGGSELFQLSISNLPAHTHGLVSSPTTTANLLNDSTSITITTQTYSAGDRRDGPNRRPWPNNVTSVTLNKETTNTSDLVPSLAIGNTGGDLPHENRPPFYSLYYIMRIS